MSQNIARTPTSQTLSLCQKLNSLGVRTTLEYWDHHKHVDIAILDAKMYIEVDGLPHYIDPHKIMTDFRRDHFSNGDDFATLRIPNSLIDEDLDAIAKAIAEVAIERIQKK